MKTNTVNRNALLWKNSSAPDFEENMSNKQVAKEK